MDAQGVELAVADLKALRLDPAKDTLVGIAASGRTPYVLACLKYAKSLGCLTLGVACSFPSIMSQCGHVDHMISVVTGPEVVTGSTRLKAGTGTKMVLNMLSTGIMIKVGKTFGNLVGVDHSCLHQVLTSQDGGFAVEQRKIETEIAAYHPQH
jgi:N-acetylmuramic acid 6-phosphate etherase